MPKTTANKTQPTSVPVKTFLSAIKDEQRRSDAQKISRIMADISGQSPVMWGPSIVGFGVCHYTYDSGREGDVPALAFSPRAANLTIYLTHGVGAYQDLLGRLGAHTTGKVCLYIKRLSDVDMKVLEEIIRISYTHVVASNNNLPRAK